MQTRREAGAQSPRCRRGQVRLPAVSRQTILLPMSHRPRKWRGDRGGQAAYQPRSSQAPILFGAAAASRHRGGNPLAVGEQDARECGHEVLVANPRKVRLIYANKRKTDEIDAENLARLARLDPRLLYPIEHRGEDSQAHMALIRSRQALVDCRTQLVNHVRGAVKSFGTRLPKCPARSFHKRAPEHIPEALRPALGPVLEQIASLTERIRDYERQLEAI